MARFEKTHVGFSIYMRDSASPGHLRNAVTETTQLKCWNERVEVNNIDSEGRVYHPLTSVPSNPTRHPFVGVCFIAGDAEPHVLNKKSYVCFFQKASHRIANSCRLFTHVSYILRLTEFAQFQTSLEPNVSVTRP